MNISSFGVLAAEQNVLGSVVKSKDTVRRVILTSSVAGALTLVASAMPSSTCMTPAVLRHAVRSCYVLLISLQILNA